jgi:hypothetical protein
MLTPEQIIELEQYPGYIKQQYELYAQLGMSTSTLDEKYGTHYEISPVKLIEFSLRRAGEKQGVDTYADCDDTHIRMCFGDDTATVDRFIAGLSAEDIEQGRGQLSIKEADRNKPWVLETLSDVDVFVATER